MRSDARPGSALRVGFFGILGSGNLGNDASLDVMVDHLRAHHRDVRLEFFAMGPAAVAARYGEPARSLQWYEAHADRLVGIPPPVLKAFGRLLDPLRTLAWVRHQDVVLVPGAGVLETTTPQRPWAMPWSLLSLGVAGRLTGARVALVDVGANVARRGPTRWLLARAAGLAHYRSYRDAMSRDAMAQMGVDVRDDRIFADLAFALAPPRPEDPDAGAIGVGVMNYRGAAEDRARAEELHEAYVAAMKRLVEALVGRGWRVRLLAGDGEDVSVQQRLLDGLGAEQRASVVVQWPTSQAELMAAVAGVRVVVGTRFHNVQAGLRASVPTISISYARKQDELMRAMGLDDFCQSAASIDVGRILDAVTDLDSRHDEVRALLEERNQVLSDLARAQLADLSSLLESVPTARRWGDASPVQASPPHPAVVEPAEHARR